MDVSKTTTTAVAPPAAKQNGRRRRWEMTTEHVRYFLPKAGSPAEKPELGKEIASEGEALIEAFRSGQVFYTLVAWRAMTEVEGNQPRIVKQALSRS